jgi:chromosome segregation ATPase
MGMIFLRKEYIMGTKRENSLERKLAASERKNATTEQKLAATRQELSESKSTLRYKKQRVRELTDSRDTHKSQKKEYKVESQKLFVNLEKIKKKDFLIYLKSLLTVTNIRH